MASVAEICNRAAQIIGSESRLVAITDNNVLGRGCSIAYEPCRDAELRAHPWNFAKTRAQLAADATAPLFGPTNAFPVPPDFARLWPSTQESDWAIENHNGVKAIVTDDGAPLDVIYIRIEEDPNVMDPLFREALAARLAYALTESITQSNSKKAEAAQVYKDAVREARRVNAMENIGEAPGDANSSWISSR